MDLLRNGFAENVTSKADLMSKKEFLKVPEMKDCRGSIILAYIICYICAVINIVISIRNNEIPVDAFMLIIFGLLIQFTNSLVAAIILLVYGIVNFIYSGAMTGTPAGILILLAGINSVRAMVKVNKAYKNYKECYR